MHTSRGLLLRWIASVGSCSAESAPSSVRHGGVGYGPVEVSRAWRSYDDLLRAGDTSLSQLSSQTSLIRNLMVGFALSQSVCFIQWNGAYCHSQSRLHVQVILQCK